MKMIKIIIQLLHKKRKISKRKYWVQPMLLQRKSKDHFNNLFQFEGVSPMKIRNRNNILIRIRNPLLSSTMTAHNFNVNFNESSNLYSFESIVSSMFLKCRILLLWITSVLKKYLWLLI